MAVDLCVSRSVIVVVGPFVSYDDGITLLSSITVSDIDCGIKKAGAAGAALTLTAVNGTNYMTPIADNPGHYYLHLTASNVDTVGPLQITFNDDDVFVPTWANFNVIKLSQWNRRYTEWHTKEHTSLVFS